MLFRMGLYTTTVRVTGVLIGAHWGLMGVAWAYVIGGYVFICYPTWARAGRLVNLSFTALLRNVEGPFACAALMGRRSGLRTAGSSAVGPSRRVSRSRSHWAW